MAILQRPQKPHPRTHAFHDWTRRGERKDLDWAASGWAGLAGGGALVLWELALAPLLLDISPSEMVQRVASIALGPDGARLTGFNVLVALTAVVVHLPLSLIYARLLASIVHDMRTRSAVIVGAVFGVALYAVNFYGFTALFPWFEGARGWPTLLGHALFGVVAAATYEGLLNAKD